jgi:hypothetical protein
MSSLNSYERISIIQLFQNQFILLKTVVLYRLFIVEKVLDYL